MTDRDIDRIDHSVLYTTDMDATATTYEALGFTLSPLSMHVGSDRPDGDRKPMGAGNRCALFGRTYLELLGLFGDGAGDPWNIRPLIAKYEGLHGCSFGCGDARAAEIWLYVAPWENPFSTALAEPAATSCALRVPCATVPVFTAAKYRLGKERKVCSRMRPGKLSENNPTPPRRTVFPSPRRSKLNPTRGCTTAFSIAGAKLSCPGERVAL